MALTTSDPSLPQCAKRGREHGAHADDRASSGAALTRIEAETPSCIWLQRSQSRSGVARREPVLGDKRPPRVSGAAVDRAAADWLPLDHSTLVVADAGLIVGEEHLADELPSAPHSRLLEHALQVLLHGVGG